MAEPEPVTVKYDELWSGFEVTSIDGGGMGISAYVDTETGNVWTSSDKDGGIHEAPDKDELEEDERYIQIPDKRYFDLGVRLVMKFADEFMPDAYDEISAMFQRKGAYRRFKQFLIDRDMADTWHRYEEAATEAALRRWGKDQGLTITE